MDKQLFDDAIGEVPPSTVDVDAAIARGRRAAWTRRVANPVVAVAAGVVLVAGGAVALTLPGNDDPVSAAQIQPTDTTEPTVPTDTTEPTVPTDTTTPTVPADTTAPSGGVSCTPPLDEAEGQRLTQALTGALQSRGLLAGTALTTDPAVEELEGPGIAPFEFRDLDQTVDGDCHVYSAGAVVDGIGRVIVSIAQPGGPLRPEVECVAGMADCQETTGPNGEGIVGFTSEGAHRVDIVKGDTIVVLSAEILQGGVAAPLTREQLTEVGLDAGLTLTP